MSLYAYMYIVYFASDKVSIKKFKITTTTTTTEREKIWRPWWKLMLLILRPQN